MASPRRPVLFLLLASLVVECLSGPVDLSAGRMARGRGGRVPLRRGLPGRQAESESAEEFESRPLYRSQVLQEQEQVQEAEQVKPDLRELYRSQVLLGGDHGHQEQEQTLEAEQVKPDLRALFLRSGKLSARARGLTSQQEQVQGNRHKKEEMSEGAEVEEPQSYNRDALAFGQAPQVPAEFLQGTQSALRQQGPHFALQPTQAPHFALQPSQAPHLFGQQAPNFQAAGLRQEPLGVQDQFGRTKPTSTTPEPQWSAQRAMYSFSSDQQDKISDLSHSRTETRSEGTVRGSYSYSDGYVLRHVQYIADRNGYRILGESTSPLSPDGPVVDPSGRAAVQADVDGQGYSYVVRGEDIYRPSFRTRRPGTQLEDT